MKKGFTIVELLIVIVVIAILAAISIVAYNGIQTRAENAKTQQALQQYARAILGYSAINGEYPIDGGYPCLGGHTNCARLSGTGTCTSNPDGGAAISAAFDTQMQQIMSGQPPQLSRQIVNCSGNTYAGAYYRGTTGKDAGIVYYLKGNISCDVAGLQVQNRVQQEDMTRCGVSFATLP